MMFRSTLILSLVTAGFSTPIILRSDSNRPPKNATFISCTEGTTDPVCQHIRQPSQDIITEIVHPNGTIEVKRNLYTRQQLHAIRIQNNVTSTKYQPGEVVHNRSAEFISNLTKRESAPPVCRTEIQRWYDTHEWGYWPQVWKQVGSCFYCDQCSEWITTSFSVSETWTEGLNYNFNEVLSVTFSFASGHTFTLSDARVCQWTAGSESGCHSIWYQPLMSYHKGNANYQTHTHCFAGHGEPASDLYYDHNWAYANVNQAASNGVVQGNVGCNSGCQGKDHRECHYGNSGGLLWPSAN